MLSGFTAYLGSVSWQRKNKKPPQAKDLWMPLEDRIKQHKIKKSKQKIIEDSKAGVVDLNERRAAIKEFKESMAPYLPQ